MSILKLRRIRNWQHKWSKPIRFSYSAKNAVSCKGLVGSPIECLIAKPVKKAVGNAVLMPDPTLATASLSASISAAAATATTTTITKILQRQCLNFQVHPLCLFLIRAEKEEVDNNILNKTVGEELKTF